jgi:hypothetical protein
MIKIVADGKCCASGFVVPIFNVWSRLYAWWDFLPVVLCVLIMNTYRRGHSALKMLVTKEIIYEAWLQALCDENCTNEEQMQGEWPCSSLKEQNWIRNIWGFQVGNYEECRLLGCHAVWLLSETTFRKNLAPPSSGWQNTWAVSSNRRTLCISSQRVLVASYG